MSKELLRPMLQDIIADRTEAATAGLHGYLRAKMRGAVGIAESADGNDVSARLRHAGRGEPRTEIDVEDIKRDLDAAGIDYEDLRAEERIDGKRMPRRDIAYFWVPPGVTEEDVADALPDFDVEFD